MIHHEDRAMIEAYEKHKHKLIGPDRINILVLTEESELKQWKKVDYGETVEVKKKGGWWWWSSSSSSSSSSNDKVDVENNKEEKEKIKFKLLEELDSKIKAIENFKKEIAENDVKDYKETVNDTSPTTSIKKGKKNVNKNEAENFNNNKEKRDVLIQRIKCK